MNAQLLQLDEFRCQFWKQISKQPWDQLERRFEDWLEDQLWRQLRRQLRSQLWRQVRDKLAFRKENRHINI